MKVIKRLKNGRSVYFKYGTFDKWCVVVGDDYKKSAPYDVDYFTYFQDLSKTYEEDKIYNDFITIYENTTKEITESTRKIIEDISLTYRDEDVLMVEENFTVIYGGMIAEMNKENTMLGKRVKHLGVFQILKENLDPTYVANFSKGKSWTELDEIMKQKNIL
jgi:hypothetical protein